MRLPSVPGPRDVVDAVARTGAAAETLLAAVPRLVGLLGEAERLVADARGLVGRIERTRAEADEVVRRTAGTVERADVVVEGAADAVAAAGAAVERVAATVEAAEVLVRRGSAVAQAAEPVVGRAAELTDGLAPSLAALQPTLERLAETTDPREVDALVTLVDTLPLLARRLQDDVLPILGTLDSVAPDLHDLLDVSRELNLMIEKLPGMGIIKRRVDEQQAEDASTG